MMTNQKVFRTVSVDIYQNHRSTIYSTISVFRTVSVDIYLFMYIMFCKRIAVFRTVSVDIYHNKMIEELRQEKFFVQYLLIFIPETIKYNLAQI